MSGFAKLPDALLLDRNITPGARCSYALLLHLAWRSGRRSDDESVELPPLTEMAEILGCATETMRKYIVELKAAGWVETIRAARGKPQLYVIHASHKNRVTRTTKSKSLARAILDPLVDETPTESLVVQDFSEPPSLVMCHGRNLGFDVLQRECGIKDNSPRKKEVGVALNGTPRSKSGIRRQFWEEIREQGWTGEGADVEVFERGLAEAIATRCKIYRQVMEGAILTPTALSKWWTDLPVMLADREQGSLTSQLLAHAEKLRQEGR